MKRMAALGGALLVTLVLAAPAAASQRVRIPELSGEWEFEVPLAETGLGFDCTGDVYYGARGMGDLWLWYPSSVNAADPEEYMPEGSAWPWIKAQEVLQGLDYFSSAPGMGGTVISGKWKLTNHSTRHHPGTPGDPNDLESWQVLSTGKSWGIQAPGHGTVFHVAGSEKGTTTVVEQVPGPYDITEWVSDGRGWRGNDTFDAEEICEALGYELAA